MNDKHTEHPSVLGISSGISASLPASSVSDERDAVYNYCGLLDQSTTVGRLSMSGEDSIDLLNRLSTNDLTCLEVGQGAFTVLITNKGRIIDLVYVVRMRDRVLLLTDVDSRGKVVDWIEFYIFTEDVAIKDITVETAMLSLLGPKSKTILEDLFRLSLSSSDKQNIFLATFGKIELTLVIKESVGLLFYDLLVSKVDYKKLLTEITNNYGGSDLKVVSAQAFQLVRVERGMPVYGKELTEQFNPLEAGLDKFISPTKGCYVGQEVVARLITYKKVKKALVGLRWEANGQIQMGSKLMLGDIQVGLLTSATESLLDGNFIGLGYVRKINARGNTRLDMINESTSIEVDVVDLPFS